jgi:hypothetical protein
MPLSLAELRSIQRLLRRAMEFIEDARAIARNGGDAIQEKRLTDARRAVADEFSDVQSNIGGRP